MAYVAEQEEKKYWEVFRGHQPSNVEMNRWPEEKFLSLIEFFKIQTNDKGNFTVKKESVNQLLERYGATSENVYWREFLIRINSDFPMTYLAKLKAMNRVFGMFLHRNPAFITKKVEEACNGLKTLQWLTETFKEEKTKQGTKIVTQTDTSGITGAPQKTPEVMYQSSIYRALDLFNQLLNAISVHDIKKMSTKEKLDGIGKLAFVLNTAKSNKTKSQVFIGLNVGKENRQSLEDKLAEYQSEQERVSEH